MKKKSVTIYGVTCLSDHQLLVQKSLIESTYLGPTFGTDSEKYNSYLAKYNGRVEEPLTRLHLSFLLSKAKMKLPKVNESPKSVGFRQTDAGCAD